MFYTVTEVLPVIWWCFTIGIYFGCMKKGKATEVMINYRMCCFKKGEKYKHYIYIYIYKHHSYFITIT